MVRRDGGKLFQMSGPQIANAPRLKSVRRVCGTMVARVDVQRTGRPLWV